MNNCELEYPFRRIVFKLMKFEILHKYSQTSRAVTKHGTNQLQYPAIYLTCCNKLIRGYSTTDIYQCSLLRKCFHVVRLPYDIHQISMPFTYITLWILVLVVPNKERPSACLVVKVLITGQEVLCSIPNCAWMFVIGWIPLQTAFPVSLDLVSKK